MARFLTDTIKIELAADAILAAAKRNKNITIASLTDELQRGDIDGWLMLAAVRACNLSQWSAAMDLVITWLDFEETHGADSWGMV